MLEISMYKAGNKQTGNCVIRVKEKPIRSTTTSKLSAMPGFKKWEGWSLVFRPTGANVLYLMDNFPEAEWLNDAGAFPERAKVAAVEQARTLQLKSGQLPPMHKGGYQYKRLPREHQRRALLVSWNKPYFALLMEQRTGKTKVVIDNSAQLFKLGRIHTLIIVTLKGVHRNWIDNEIPEDLPDWCHRETFFMKSSHTRRQQDRFERTINCKNGLRIFAFNIEAFSRGGRACDMFEEAMGDGKGVFLAIDESTCIKTYGSKCTKYMLKFGTKAEYRRTLTGTQCPEGTPEELFPQYKFLSPDILGYDTITTYRSQFVVTRIMKLPDANGHKLEKELIVPGCRNVEELQALIDPYSFRVLRRDCMDLPPKIYKRWPVEMTVDQKRLYSELRDDYITEFKGKELTATLAMTRLMRLQQIVCGWFPMDEDELRAGETWKNVRAINKENPRMIALSDILESHPDDKAIIWARFRPDLEEIQKHLGRRAVSYHGGIGEDKKAENYRRFQKDSSIQYFVANPASAGFGLTLTAAGMEVYYSNSYSLKLRLQSEDRPEGEGKKDSTLIIDLETVGTVDTKIIRSLKNKKDVADLINRDPKSLFMEEDYD